MDDLILNIQIPVRKPTPVASTPKQEFKGAKAHRNDRGRDFKNKNPVYKNRSDSEGANNGRYVSREDLLDPSRKIKKQFNPKKQRNLKQYNENAEVEELFNVSEKKDEVPNVFVGNNFEDIEGINPKLLSALQENKKITLTKIQKESIPVIMREKDCIIKSETGSGKTLAYLVPLINKMGLLETKIQRQDGTYCVVICPTRELCVQVVETCKIVLKNLIHIVVGAIMGGESIQKEKARLRKGINILVCTPGRLVYHMENTTSFNYKPLKYIVFEESDRTLDMGFKKDLDKIIALVSQRSDYEQIQKILISANFSDKIEALTMKIAPNECVHIGFQPKMDLEGNETEESKINQDSAFVTPTTLAQKYLVVEEGHRTTFLLSVLIVSEKSKIMIFVSTCDEAEFLETLFNEITYTSNQAFDDGNEGDTRRLINNKIFKLHGKVDQKQRTKTYLDFKKSADGILICTDVASRGLDFEDVRLIVQFDPPASITDYVNRMGRTARIGNYGMSLIFLTEGEVGYVQKLKDNGIQIEKFEQESYNQFIEDKFKSQFREDYGAQTFLSFRIREMIKASVPTKIKARKAYISYVRSYARFKEKDIFHPKKLNLQRLARSFGLVTSQAVKHEMDSEGLIPRPQFKESLDSRSYRRPLPSRVLEKLEFL